MAPAELLLTIHIACIVRAHAFFLTGAFDDFLRLPWTMC